MPVLSVRASLLLATCLLVSLSSVAFGAPPSVTDLDIRGLQIGASTTVHVSGSNLGTDARLLIPGVHFEQSVVESPGNDPAQRLAIAVQVQSGTRPGIYPMWVATPRGISNPVAVLLDPLPQLPFREQTDSLPVALHGRLQGDAILTTTFAGRAGMRLVIDMQSRRLAANTRPVIRLLDSRGTQLEWSQGIDRLSGDARLQFQLPADDQYTVQLHDVVYRGESPGYFCLQLGELAYADMAFPLGIQRGQSAEFDLLLGNLAGTKVAATADPNWLFRTMPIVGSAANLTGSTPRIAVSEFPELVETPGDANPFSLPGAPIAVSGRLETKQEEDRYLLNVQPGQVLRAELFAERVGAPIDGVLLVRDANGNELARADDQAGTPDPVLDYTVPANTNQIIIGVTDLLKQGGEPFVYRLQVRDTALPQFNLSIDTDRITIPAGGSQIVRVSAQRMGYGGPIALEWEGLPPEVQVSGQPLAAGVDTALVALRAPVTAVAPTIVRVIGHAAEGDQPHRSVAVVPDTLRAETHPWSRQYVGVATGEPSPIQLAVSGNPFESLTRGAKIAVPFTVTRSDGVSGNVRVRLVSNQPMPKKTITENNQPREVDDVERALRLEAEVIVDAAASEGVAQLLVPGDLEEKLWSLALTGELLAADNTTVVATTSTEVRTLPVQSPLHLELASSPAIEAKAGLGDTGKFNGRVVRSPGFDQPITVTITGLPEGYAAPSAQVPAGHEQFELPVAFAYGVAAAELNNVQLVAETSAPAGGSVRSAALPVQIKVVPGEKPPVEQPLVIFEDEAAITEQLSKGNGQISLETGDKYSGEASVKITPDQRFNDQLASLGVRIREKPAPGEYRYLTFAWKKSGGQAICVQLNHDGTWGPGGSGREGAKFRYHAGPLPEVYGGSMSLDQNLPTEFVVVTRDLFADFGEFTLTGLALSAVDGEHAIFDHIYLGRNLGDFELATPKASE